MKNPNSEKCQKLWDEYKEFKNKNVTRISKGIENKILLMI